ncbi:hypothetical protein SOPP22_15960 [Shewanella sp. OPT22]|nr:hypothetical protein SOPP22_15960 [Shewanella sp. OPT22]
MTISSDSPQTWGQELTNYSKDVFWPTASSSIAYGPVGGGVAFATSSGLYILKRSGENCKPGLKSSNIYKGLYHGANIALPALAAFHSQPQQCAQYAFDTGCKVIKGIVAVIPYVTGNGAGALVDECTNQSKPEDVEEGSEHSEDVQEKKTTSASSAKHFTVSMLIRVGAGAVPSSLFFALNAMLYN